MDLPFLSLCSFVSLHLLSLPPSPFFIHAFLVFLANKIKQRNTQKAFDLCRDFVNDPKTLIEVAEDLGSRFKEYASFSSFFPLFPFLLCLHTYQLPLCFF